MINLQFNWSPSDYRCARKLWLLRHPWRAFEEAPDTVSYLAACLLISVLGTINPEGGDGVTALRAAGMAIFIIAVYYCWFVWRSNRQFRQNYSGSTRASASIDERGITLATGATAKTHLWVGFTRIYGSGRVIVLEKGGDEFFYLPKTAMSTGQLSEFKRLTANTIDCRVVMHVPLM